LRLLFRLRWRMPMMSCGRLGGDRSVEAGFMGDGLTVRSADDEIYLVGVDIMQRDIGTSCRGLEEAYISVVYLSTFIIELTPLSKTHSIVSPSFSGRDFVVISPSSPSGSVPEKHVS
jgi:hypothetical protein